jgi:hypothetical protein
MAIFGRRRENAMQKLMLCLTAVAALVLFAPLSAVEGQSDTEPAIATAPRTVNLTAEQRFIIKEIVYKDLKVPKAAAGAPESIGDPVPADVELHDMTAELGKKFPAPSRTNSMSPPTRSCWSVPPTAPWPT